MSVVVWIYLATGDGYGTVPYCAVSKIIMCLCVHASQRTCHERELGFCGLCITCLRASLPCAGALCVHPFVRHACFRCFILQGALPRAPLAVHLFELQLPVVLQEGVPGRHDTVRAFLGWCIKEGVHYW
jgi:hypothetical protein